MRAPGRLARPHTEGVHAEDRASHPGGRPGTDCCSRRRFSEIYAPSARRLLLEETLTRSHLRRRILPFDDSVAFRFAYESRFRSRWDRGETADLVVVVRAESHPTWLWSIAESHQLAILPYDLLRAGRQLSFGLNELLPGLSYPVVASLDRSLRVGVRQCRHLATRTDDLKRSPLDAAPWNGCGTAAGRRRDEGLRVAARLRHCARARQAAG